MRNNVTFDANASLNFANVTIAELEAIDIQEGTEFVGPFNSDTSDEVIAFQIDGGVNGLVMKGLIKVASAYFSNNDLSIAEVEVKFVE